MFRNHCYLAFTGQIHSETRVSERCDMNFASHGFPQHLEYGVITQKKGVMNPFFKGQKETPGSCLTSLSRLTQWALSLYFELTVQAEGFERFTGMSGGRSPEPAG